MCLIRMINIYMGGQVVSICLYFQVHQPFRMNKYRIFDVGQHTRYFDEEKNKQLCKSIAKRCYIPANNLLLKAIEETDGKFRVAFSISGVALEQFEKYAPEVIESFRKLAKTGCVEFMAETYYHSLASLFSENEFEEQVKMHHKKMKDLFLADPKVFRNTELIYNDDVASFAKTQGYDAVLSEGADHILGWRTPNVLYSSHDIGLALLLKNYQFSDDIAFRFSERSWDQWPLTTEKFVNWIKSIHDDSEIVNLFMDYETLGEHQREETGIFDFFSELPKAILTNDSFDFKTPSEIAKEYEPKDALSVKKHTSWADEERDTSAWLGNKMQVNALTELYKLEEAIKSANDTASLDDWRLLTTSDHFYYMSTKAFGDGAVHSYFNPYDTPYESFISFMNIMNDLIYRLKQKNINVENIKKEVQALEKDVTTVSGNDR